MDEDDPTVYVAFPPLESVIGLSQAPPPVSDLIHRRWLAEPAPPDAGCSFLLHWRIDRDGGASLDDARDVRWLPDGELGWLRNRSGRIAVRPDADESTVDLYASARSGSDSFEALVEAALAHALTARGECFLHAAAFETAGRRPLVIGASGTGKSTLASAVLAAGGRVISDDSLLLGVHEGRPVLRAARRNVWLRPGSEALLPGLRQRGLSMESAADGRIRLDRDGSPEAFEGISYPDCLVVLESSGRSEVEHRQRPLSQAEALAALLHGTSALYVTDERFVRRQRALLRLMTQFAEALPAVGLRVGSSLLESPEESLAAVAAALPV